MKLIGIRKIWCLTLKMIDGNTCYIHFFCLFSSTIEKPKNHPDLFLFFCELAPDCNFLFFLFLIHTETHTQIKIGSNTCCKSTKKNIFYYIFNIKKTQRKVNRNCFSLSFFWTFYFNILVFFSFKFYLTCFRLFFSLK